jgi:hypothetical protein
MKVYQGEIVEVNFLLPNGEFKPHPTIVISCNLVSEIEDAFIGVMISSSALSNNSKSNLCIVGQIHEMSAKFMNLTYWIFMNLYAEIISPPLHPQIPTNLHQQMDANRRVLMCRE